LTKSINEEVNKLIENLINVVGTLNMEELDEILAIARVFLVEERMKNITKNKSGNL